MKRLISWVLLLAMCLSLFAGCGNENNNTDPTNAPVAGGQSGSLEDAVSYVRTIYKNAGEMTAADFQRIGAVPMGGTKYEIVWTANVSEDLVKIVVGEDGMVTIDVNEETPEEVAYVLTATITAPDGASESLSWNHVIPAAVGDDMGAIVDMAYELADGQTLPNEATLTGVITSIDTPWSPDYKNITVTIQVAERPDKPIMCYRLKGEGADALMPGDTITVTGILKNYKGTIEFDQGCNLDSVVKGEGGVDIPTDPGEIVKAAYALKPGESLPYTATLTGKIISLNTHYSEYYKNVTVTIEVAGYRIQCFRLKGEGADKIYVNDTITVTGSLTNYQGKIEFNAGCTLDSYVKGNAPVAPEDQTQIVDEIYALQEVNGSGLAYPAHLTGVITSIDKAWSDSNGCITVTMAVPGREDKPIQCYKLKGEGASDLDIGDTITVFGWLKNYKGTAEFKEGCELVNVVKAPTDAEIVEQAYQLAEGETLEGTHTLTGTIISVDSAYSNQYKNVTVTIAIAGAEGKPIQCFRLKGNGADQINVLDTITVTGTLKNYQGKIEFDAGCKLEYYTKASQVDIVKAAYALEPNAVLGKNMTLSGVVTSIDTAYSEQYGNITVTIAVEGAEDMPIQCFRLKGENAANITVGDTISVTGTLKNYKGKIEFDAGCILNYLVKPGSSMAQIVMEAYKLAEGESMEGAQTLTGVITKIDTAYSSQYKNVSVVIVVDGMTDMPILCYRLKGEGADSIAVGDTITVTGTLKNYYGTIEFDAGCTLDSVVKGETVEAPTDPVEIVKAAYALEAGESLPYTATLTGVISEITSEYSEQYKNITLIIKVAGAEDMPIICYRLKGEGAADLKVGDTITVTGTLMNYGGDIEFGSGCTFVKP